MPQSYANFIRLAISELASTTGDFSRVKKDISKKLRVPVPANADLREEYEKMVTHKTIPKNPHFEAALFSKKIRTRSGVAVIAVLTKPYACPGKCIFCPSQAKMPKSYLKNEPAVMRALSVKFDPYDQVRNRIRALELNGHKTDKIELIVMGGTFSYLPKSYQIKFITECFRACNDYPSNPLLLSKEKAGMRLSKEQKKNEKAKRRIIGLTLETRPDFIDEKEISNFRNLGCTRVELGVQSIFDDVLAFNKRGHDIEKTIQATKLLKDAGFKISYHMMPGLPGSDLQKDLQMFKTIFSSPDFQPDMLKIYPTVVLADSELHSLWGKNQYLPLNDEQFQKLVLEVKNELIPEYVRISRLVRDVPAESIIAGPIISNLRQLIEHRSKCRCIRCREVKDDWQKDEKIILDRTDYAASDGKEIFLQMISNDRKKLFALLRLRIAKNNNANHFDPALRNAALIREVHTYGKLTGIDKKDQTSHQHIGLGKKLIQEAEKIAKNEFNAQKIAVISGIGARNYYRKLGYRLSDTYMLKRL